MKKVCLFLSLLLTMGLLCGCSNDESEQESKDTIVPISGTIHFSTQEGEECVFIENLNMPKGYEYKYIETVVVPLKDFPFQNYAEGDVITFVIVKVESEYPINQGIHNGLYRATSFMCSIIMVINMDIHNENRPFRVP